MRGTILLTLFALLAAPVSLAGPREDAQAVVNITVTEDMMAASFEALSELVVGNFQNEAAKHGKILSEDAAKVLGKMMFDEMIPLLASAMRKEMATAYVYSMSPEALADYRAFLETPSGAEWAAAQAGLMRETAKVSQNIALPVATEAVSRMNEDIAAGKWPPGTLQSTKVEIQDFLEE